MRRWRFSDRAVLSLRPRGGSRGSRLLGPRFDSAFDISGGGGGPASDLELLRPHGGVPSTSSVKTVESQFGSHERVRYSRDQLLQLREVQPQPRSRYSELDNRDWLERLAELPTSVDEQSWETIRDNNNCQEQLNTEFARAHISSSQGTVESRFGSHERVWYSRDQLLQLREAVNVPEDILKLKQETEAEFVGKDQNWGCGDANMLYVPFKTYSQVSNAIDRLDTEREAVKGAKPSRSLVAQFSAEEVRAVESSRPNPPNLVIFEDSNNQLDEELLHGEQSSLKQSPRTQSSSDYHPAEEDSAGRNMLESSSPDVAEVATQADPNDTAFFDMLDKSLLHYIDIDIQPAEASLSEQIGAFPNFNDILGFIAKLKTCKLADAIIQTGKVAGERLEAMINRGLLDDLLTLGLNKNSAGPWGEVKALPVLKKAVQKYPKFLTVFPQEFQRIMDGPGLSGLPAPIQIKTIKCLLDDFVIAHCSLYNCQTLTHQVVVELIGEVQPLEEYGFDCSVLLGLLGVLREVLWRCSKLDNYSRCHAHVKAKYDKLEGLRVEALQQLNEQTKASFDERLSLTVKKTTILKVVQDINDSMEQKIIDRELIKQEIAKLKNSKAALDATIAEDSEALSLKHHEITDVDKEATAIDARLKKEKENIDLLSMEVEKYMKKEKALRDHFDGHLEWIKELCM